MLNDHPIFVVIIGGAGATLGGDTDRRADTGRRAGSPARDPGRSAGAGGRGSTGIGPIPVLDASRWHRCRVVHGGHGNRLPTDSWPPLSLGLSGWVASVVLALP